MTDQYVGEIRAVGFNFAPQGWALCNGQLLPISQNTELFSLLDVTYGGDGESTFGLPDLRSRFPMHASPNPAGLSPTSVGEAGGAAAVAISQSTLPAHSHAPSAVESLGTVNSPRGAYWAQPHYGRGLDQVYATSGGTAPMATSMFGPAGGDQPHNNLPPYLVVNFIIALSGIFPPRS